MRSALVCALCLALAACGGDAEEPPLTKAQYEQRAGSILEDMAGEPGAFDPTTVDDETRRAADRLAELAPPADIGDLHLLLVDGLESLARDLQDAENAMQAGPGELQEALDRIARSPGGEQAENALREMEERGYRLPHAFGAQE